MWLCGTDGHAPGEWHLDARIKQSKIWFKIKIHFVMCDFMTTQLHRAVMSQMVCVFGWFCVGAGPSCTLHSRLTGDYLESIVFNFQHYICIVISHAMSVLISLKMFNSYGNSNQDSACRRRILPNTLPSTCTLNSSQLTRALSLCRVDSAASHPLSRISEFAMAAQQACSTQDRCYFFT